ncbi:response regulator transcription factor [Duganella qianjiadongensis]|uniref:Response regulator n=1 Tax=Duganella qianjiadongensis TaxID=2692176 RepID=A0ABW9VST2_9BURK|nr:response regulator transcription factor [Duganella qianjiadongensis]MYM42134.1 response regulator [Duganella qianjiadongensis]
MSEALRVILVEDDQDLRESISEWMSLHHTPITAVSNASEFYQALLGQAFQIAILDLNLPDQQGFVLAEYARANYQMGVVILTARSGIDDKLKGYQSGADAYLVKPVDCRELAAVILSVAARSRSAASVQACATPSTQGWQISLTQWTLRYGQGSVILLSQKELHLMQLLAAQPGSAVQKRTILSRLYQRDDYHCSRSLDTLIRRLRNKVLNQIGIEAPLRTVHSVGYCFAGEIRFEETDFA